MIQAGERIAAMLRLVQASGHGRLPWFPVDVDAADAELGGLTNEARGMHLRMLLMAWRATPPCSVPADPEALLPRFAPDLVAGRHDTAATARRKRKDWEALWHAIEPLWPEHDGHRYNVTLVDAMARTLERSRAHSANGRAGAAKRWRDPEPAPAQLVMLDGGDGMEIAISRMSPVRAGRLEHVVSRLKDSC